MEIRSQIKMFMDWWRDLSTTDKIAIPLGVLLVLSFAIIETVPAESILEWFFPRESDQLPAHDEYQQKLEELSEIERNLEGLMAFIDDQRKTIAAEQQVISQLEQEKDALAEEKEKLEPLVEAQREAIDALLEIQERRARRERYVDWAMGFALGFLTEILIRVLPPAISRLRGARSEGA